MLPLLEALLPRGDCCWGIASDRRGDVGPLSFFDETGVDGAVDSSAAFVLGAKDTLLLLLEGEVVSGSLWERGSGDAGWSEAFGDRVSDSKDAAFRTSSSFIESLSFLSVLASLDSLGGVATLPTLLPPGLRLAREASANADASSVGSTFFLPDTKLPSMVSFASPFLGTASVSFLRFVDSVVERSCSPRSVINRLFSEFVVRCSAMSAAASDRACW